MLDPKIDRIIKSISAVGVKSDFGLGNFIKSYISEKGKGFSLKSGEFWNVIISKNYDFVLKIAKKPSGSLEHEVIADFELLNKYLSKYLVKQEVLSCSGHVVLLQEKVLFPFQIGAGIFERTLSKDRLILRLFSQLNNKFKKNLVEFEYNCRKMLNETGKVIDLWGSGNVVFDFPWRSVQPKLLDTTFLFHNINTVLPKTRDQIYMKEGYDKSVFCLDKLLKILNKNKNSVI